MRRTKSADRCFGAEYSTGLKNTLRGQSEYMPKYPTNEPTKYKCSPHEKPKTSIEWVQTFQYIVNELNIAYELK